MEDTEGRKCELEMEGLSLIDVTSEDDCLLFSSFLDPDTSVPSEDGLDDGVLGFFGKEHDYREKTPFSPLQEKEQVLQPHDSPEPEKTKKGGKYNLRKSMAWDNAFFTNDGVLEPEELSSIIESNQRVEKHVLSTIQEDVRRSTESISTLQSDCTIEDMHEPVYIFEDIRASIQKSCKVSDVANILDRKESGATKTVIIPPSSKTSSGIPQNKLKHKASPKVPSIGDKRMKAGKLGSLPPPASQVVPSREALSMPGSRPPKDLSRVNPMPTISTKRASLDVNRAKPQKDAKMIGGKVALGSKAPALGRAKNVLPKPVLTSKASVRSSAMSKNDLNSSCSSLESCISTSSNSSYRSSLNPITKKKNDSSSKTDKPSFMARSTSRNVSKSIGQSRNPHISTQAMSKSRLYSSKSAASSFSEWSSDSSMTSTCSERAGSKVHMRSISDSIDDSSGALNSLNNFSDKSVAGCDSTVTELACEGKRVSTSNSGIAHPASIKPTGLRMPAPKIGFFDGARTVTRTPNRNLQCHPGTPSSMPTTGCRTPSGHSSNARIGNLQSAKSLVQELSNLKMETSNDSRVSSQKIQSKMLPKTIRGKQLKSESDNAMRGSGKKSSPVSVKDKMSPGSRNNALSNDIKMASDHGQLEISVDKNIISSIKLGEEGNTEANVSEGEINKSAKQNGALDSIKMIKITEDCTEVFLSPEQTVAAQEVDCVSGKKIALIVESSGYDGDDMLADTTGQTDIVAQDTAASVSSPEIVPEANS